MRWISIGGIPIRVPPAPGLILGVCLQPPSLECHNPFVNGLQLKRNVQFPQTGLAEVSAGDKLRAFASYWFKTDQSAVLLKRRCPWLYRKLREIFERFWT